MTKSSSFEGTHPSSVLRPLRVLTYLGLCSGYWLLVRFLPTNWQLLFLLLYQPVPKSPQALACVLSSQGYWQQCLEDTFLASKVVDNPEPSAFSLSLVLGLMVNTLKALSEVQSRVCCEGNLPEGCALCTQKEF